MSKPELLDQIYNYRRISAQLATSGQPDEEELAAIAADGYEVVINIALHDDPRYALADEAGEVARLGMRYVHLPVVFTAPTHEDLRRFFAIMDAETGKRVWLHCAANKRVSAFLGLYRVLVLGWEREAAFDLLREIWEPDVIWSRFIDEALAGTGDPSHVRQPG